MRGKGEEHYNDNAANYFILFVLAIITIPSTILFLKKRLNPPRDTTTRCPCTDCKKKEEDAQVAIKKGPSVGSIVKAVVLVILWILLFVVLYNATMTTEQRAAGYFDPYEILGLAPGASIEVIKKTYKQLSLIHHPDKADNPLDPDVQNKYIMIVKAYETLTDDAIRENWEKHGNPDGPQAMSVGIALPSFLVRKDNTLLVLSVYMALLVIGLPTAVGLWWRSWKKYDTSSKVMHSTMGLYYHQVDPMARMRSVVELIACSEEYKEIPLRESDTQLEKVLKSIPDNHQPKKPKFNLKYGFKTQFLFYTQICRQQNELKSGLKGDLTFVLSKVRSLIGGMITICTARAYFLPILESLQFLQTLTQSCWRETPLLQLPHFTEYNASSAAARKFNAHDLVSFQNMNPEKKKEFYEKEGFKPDQVKDIENVLSFMPTKVAMEYSVAVEGEDEIIVTGAIVTFLYSITRDPTDPTKVNTIASVKKPIEPDTPSIVKKRSAIDAARQRRFVHAPQFPGEQRDECWWIVIGDVRTSGTTGGLAGINKVGSIEQGPVEGKIKFMAPATEGSYTYVAHLICDGYAGCDKKTEFRIKVVKDLVAERERAAHAERMQKKHARIKEIKENGEEVVSDDDDSFSDSEDDEEN